MNTNQKKYIIRYDSSIFLKAANIISVFSSLILLLILCVINSSAFPNDIWSVLIDAMIFVAVIFALVVVFRLVKTMVQRS